MKKAVFFFSFVFSFSAVLSQNPCYFALDTGTTSSDISQSMVELPDGSIYVTGIQGNGPYGANDIPLLKIDSCGNLLWIKYYGDSLSSGGLYINKTYDNKLVICGDAEVATNSNDAFLMKLDTSGNVLFQKFYSDHVNQSLKYVEETSDHGFILCGFADNSNGNDSYFLKVDSVGIKQWDQVLGGAGNEYADAIHELPDGKFIGTGDANSYGNGGYDVEIFKFHANGAVLWDYTYGDALNNGCQGIYLMSNGNYFSFGETEVYPGSPFDFYIEQIDTAGNSLGRHLFGGGPTDAIFSVLELPGMNFLCTGYSRSYNNLQAYDMVLFKIDTTGDIKWLKNFYNPGIDIGYQLLPSVKGDYLLTGLRNTNGTNYFVVRSDTIANIFPGISESPSQKKNDLLFPNPANGTTQLRSALPYDEVRVYDFMGKKMKTVAAGESAIYVGDLSFGVYQVLFFRNGMLLERASLQVLR
jgi:hypothetical protein